MDSGRCLSITAAVDEVYAVVEVFYCRSLQDRLEEHHRKLINR